MRKALNVVKRLRSLPSTERYGYCLDMWNHHWESMSVREINFIGRYVRMFC